jgi:hypothetical protein
VKTLLAFVPLMVGGFLFPMGCAVWKKWPGRLAYAGWLVFIGIVWELLLFCTDFIVR